jgi:hypothetical protein
VAKLKHANAFSWFLCFYQCFKNRTEPFNRLKLEQSFIWFGYFDNSITVSFRFKWFKAVEPCLEVFPVQCVFGLVFKTLVFTLHNYLVENIILVAKVLYITIVISHFFFISISIMISH